MMRNCITVSSIFILLTSACTSDESQKEEPKEKDYKEGSLLLPEHQDTTTVYTPLPDSITNDLNFGNVVTVGGEEHLKIGFDHLAKVTVDQQYFNEEVGMEIQVVNFSEEVQSLEGKSIVIRGFLLPIDHAANFFVLSKNPYNSCFFCNQAGIETIVELKFEGRLPFKPKMDQIILVSGILELSSNDPTKLPYTLKDVQILEFN